MISSWVLKQSQNNKNSSFVPSLCSTGWSFDFLVKDVTPLVLLTCLDTWRSVSAESLEMRGGTLNFGTRLVWSGW